MIEASKVFIITRSANGDHIYSEARALRISKKILGTCIEAGIFPPQVFIYPYIASSSANINYR